MTDNPINKWLIISWRHIDHLDDKYGRLMAEFTGTQEQAEVYAREWVPTHAPIGIVREVFI